MTLSALKLDKKYFNDAKKIIDDLGLSVMMAKESVKESTNTKDIKYQLGIDYSGNTPPKVTKLNRKELQVFYGYKVNPKDVLKSLAKVSNKKFKHKGWSDISTGGGVHTFIIENRRKLMNKNTLLTKIVKEELVRIKEARMKKVDKNWWRKASDDKRFDALLSVVKDPDDAEKYIDTKWRDLPSGFERDMTIYESMLGEAKTFKPGDMWSDDFDYKGMLVYGMKYKPTGDLRKDINVMSSLHDSFEDVNYHSESSPLWSAMKLYTQAFGAKSNPAKQGQLAAKADAELAKFNKACAKTLKGLKEGLNESLNSSQEKKVLKTLQNYVKKYKPKDGDTTEIADMLAQVTKLPYDKVLDYILDLAGGNDVIIFENKLNEVTAKDTFQNAVNALTKTIGGRKFDKGYVKDYLKSIEKIARKNPGQFVKDYGDFEVADWIEDVRYNMANESKLTEVKPGWTIKSQKIIQKAMGIIADKGEAELNDYPGGDIDNGKPYLQFNNKKQASIAFKILKKNRINAKLDGDAINLAEGKLNEGLENNKPAEKIMKGRKVREVLYDQGEYYVILDNGRFVKFSTWKITQGGAGDLKDLREAIDMDGVFMKGKGSWVPFKKRDINKLKDYLDRKGILYRIKYKPNGDGEIRINEGRPDGDYTTYGLSDEFSTALDNLPEKDFNKKNVVKLAKKMGQDPKEALQYAIDAFGWMKNMKEEFDKIKTEAAPKMKVEKYDEELKDAIRSLTRFDNVLKMENPGAHGRAKSKLKKAHSVLNDLRHLR